MQVVCALVACGASAFNVEGAFSVAEATEADSARATLTWQGRFRDVPKKCGATVYNYYSGEDGTTGDEVLELMATTPSPTSGFEWLKAKGRYSWQK